MFSSSPNYNKLKTNLRLAVNRLKLLEKKKSELTQKARKEIADYLAMGKPERAKIRVEHIVREDYLVEAMEIIEMYCDLLLARFGLITQMKELDEGIAEAVASLIWAAPRLQADVLEMKTIGDILTAKYGKPFADEQRAAASETHKVSPKLLHKMAIQAPPKLLVEKYLIEIAKIYHIDYEPDPQTMQEHKDGILIDLSDRNNLDGPGGSIPQAPGFIGYPPAPQMPPLPMPPAHRPFDYPNMGPGPSNGNNGGNSVGGGGGGGSSVGTPFPYNIPPNPNAPPMSPPRPPTSSSSSSSEKKDLNFNSAFSSAFIQEESGAAGRDGIPSDANFPPPSYDSLSPDDNLAESNKPKPQPRSKFSPDQQPGGTSGFVPHQPAGAASTHMPDLPNVPLDLPDIPDDSNNEEIDFDDLSKRFEELKRRK